MWPLNVAVTVRTVRPGPASLKHTPHVTSASRHRHDHQPPPQHSETQSSRHVAVMTISLHPSTLKHRAHVTSPLRPSATPPPYPHPPHTFLGPRLSKTKFWSGHHHDRQPFIPKKNKSKKKNKNNTNKNNKNKNKKNTNKKNKNSKKTVDSPEAQHFGVGVVGQREKRVVHLVNDRAQRVRAHTNETEHNVSQPILTRQGTTCHNPYNQDRAQRVTAHTNKTEHVSQPILTRQNTTCHSPYHRDTNTIIHETTCHDPYHQDIKQHVTTHTAKR